MKIVDEYREAEPMDNGQRRILWDKVDPLLKYDVRQPGDLWKLAVRVGVHEKVLRKRRKQLGLPPLQGGRPRVTTLTPLQEEVSSRREAGERVVDIASSRGVTPQAISGTMSTVRAKKAEQCQECFGTGVVPSKGCCGVGSHFHVCLKCGDGVPQRHKEIGNG